MSNETRENKEIHERQKLAEKNKRLAEMGNEEFSAEFDKLADDDAKKILEKMQEKQGKGES